MVGAILTQNTAWSNVGLAIQNLREADALTPFTLADLPQRRLEELIRPTGYFRQKARKLSELLVWFNGHYEGEIEKLCQADSAHLRRELLSVWGIGPETADSILLYAIGVPVFVVDAYTIRVLARHGVVPLGASYEEVQHIAHEHLPMRVDFLNEAHALFVAVGKNFCLRRAPKCDGCPLEELLPHDGPIQI